MIGVILTYDRRHMYYLRTFPRSILHIIYMRAQKAKGREAEDD
jgi:hypothetical protein